MFEEPFAVGDSVLHRCDPRGKLVCAAAFSLTVALAPALTAPALALALALCLVCAARPPLGALLRRLAAVNAFIVFLWLLVPFTAPGTPVWRLGPLVASAEGLHLAVLITLKANAIVLALLALVLTSDAASLGQAMYRLGVPEKLAFLFLFTYRFIQVSGEEYGRLRVAARLRGFQAKTGLHTYRTLASLLAVLLLRSFERAERVHKAMLLRGFDGRFVSLREFSMRRADAVLLVLMLSCSAGLACLEILERFGRV
ncbi:cobalt ABC transporter, inner membrane subunit CbiQ [Desulfovibrio sp. X2]|uniref:cobalt ECF transporter T component CbiQ n=1 Tax=Desulfovibrio sp. X2 TaxID=941449 RepID=UPI000358AE06|nr:cobalt ECF transporter T component CbiQ [Desulfovibrio sp. X2]EPR37350.1 cobalt ABC transporter, inner membrane subunit CbiQ [Desulfovibrio sp. X2]